MKPKIQTSCKKVAIMNFHFSRCNYGSLMVPFALSHIIKRLGYFPYIVNYIPSNFIKELKGLGYSAAKDLTESYYFSNCPFIKFRREFLNLTNICYSDKDLSKLAGQFQRFISGSDQVWRSDIFDNKKYMFDWLFGQKLIISYAASFGFDEYFENSENINTIKRLLSRFDAISVREDTGVSICKNKFGIQSIQTLDPTLLLDESDYNIILNDNVISENEYVGYMLLDDAEVEKIESVGVLQQLKIKYKFINLIKDRLGNNRSFSSWLNYIKNAKYIITNSFHGSVFCIIFKKQFICISRDFEANSRIESIFKALDINDQLFVKHLTQAQNILYHQIDYEKVFRNLAQERKKSIEYLTASLSLPLTVKT